MTTLKIAARPQTMDVTACSSVLMGSMQRLVINKDIPALREFRRMGIPLDYALDYSVQKGSMPLIDELLNNLGVVPSESTLLRAMRRGQMIRNMFLVRVTPTLAHLNAAVIAENFDTANLLLDRQIEPAASTVAAIKASDTQTDDRRVFIDRLVNTLATDQLNYLSVLGRLPLWTSIAQFERALDRTAPLTLSGYTLLLTECLRAAAPGHARVLLNRGTLFEASHLHICGDQTWNASDANPKRSMTPVMTTVLETGIEEGVRFKTADEVYHLARPVVTMYCFTAHDEFMSLCNLLARVCESEARPDVGRFIITEAGNKQRRQRGAITMEHVNDLIEPIREMFRRDPAPVMSLDETSPSPW
jgi:hypothetical protein